MIIVTGGAGFIGSALIWKLNEQGFRDIVVVDRLGTGPKWKNLNKKSFLNIIHKDHFFNWLRTKPKGVPIEAVFHMGACSSTQEKDADYLISNNFHFSTELFDYCAREKVPFIYASSAATYGMGKQGFLDKHETICKLQPNNAYGFSKNIFDQWVLRQKERPGFWAGLKFFNVYGPNEYHKGSQASVAFHAFPQVRDKKELKLFKSYKPGVADGEQKRDFVYVKDVVDVIFHLFRASSLAVSGIYNVGSGKAHSFADLGRAVFTAMGHKHEHFNWIEMPEDLKSQYQYFTEANIDKLREFTGYKKPFTSLEDGVNDYVRNYLALEDPYL